MKTVTYRATPGVSGWLIEWITQGPVRGYHQYPALRVESGIAITVQASPHSFFARVQVDGDADGSIDRRSLIELPFDLVEPFGRVEPEAP